MPRRKQDVLRVDRIRALQLLKEHITTALCAAAFRHVRTKEGSGGSRAPGAASPSDARILLQGDERAVILPGCLPGVRDRLRGSPRTLELCADAPCAEKNRAKEVLDHVRSAGARYWKKIDATAPPTFSGNWAAGGSGGCFGATSV